MTPQQQKQRTQTGLRTTDEIQDALTEGYIDIRGASRKYNVPLQTIHTWLRRGYLTRYGRIRAPGGEGGHVVLSEAEFVKCMETPKKRGRRPSKRSG